MFTGRRVLMVLTAMSVTMSMVNPALARGGGRVAHAARAAHSNYHPRMREAMGRNRNMNNRMNRDYDHLGGNYGKLQGERHNVAQQERQDFNKQGYLTKGQKQQFNKDDNQINRQIANDYRGRGNWNRGPGDRGQWDRRQDRRQWDREHPRQSQLLGSDSRLGRELGHDKGQLGGNYSSLKSEQQAIRKEDRTDAKANGGYITPAQRKQMDGQEKQLQQQIKTDYKKP